jgi:hypothetical protein
MVPGHTGMLFYPQHAGQSKNQKKAKQEKYD